MKKIMSIIMLVTLAILLCACGETGNKVGAQKNSLSDTCDYVLCCGTDKDWNVYELVANQTETAKGFEIAVGVIKNNEWLYPLSTEFPFLNSNNCFSVWKSIYSYDKFSFAYLSDAGEVLKVAENIFFLNSGAFLMESFNTGPDAENYPTAIIFSCDTQKSYTIDLKENNLMYDGFNATSDNYGRLCTYGNLSGDGVELLYYSDADNEKEKYDWYTVDVQTLNVKKIAANVSIKPTGILSEGLIFANDKCFYDTSMNKVIDLSEYDIARGCYNGMCFYDGSFDFIAKNSIGTEFEIRIDKSGSVILESKIG